MKNIKLTTIFTILTIVVFSFKLTFVYLLYDSLTL